MVERKGMNFTVLRDYILKYFPDLLWWDGYHTHEKWDSKHSYKHRQGMPNEIRIEFDNEDTNQNWINVNDTCIDLWTNGYSFAVFYVEGGRSPHIHIYDLDELDTLEYDDRTKFRKLFLRKHCPKNSNPDYSLCDEKHLCALEFANHFKYNKPKQLLFLFWNGKNMGIDFDLKIGILFDKKKPLKEKKPLKFGEQLTLNASSRLRGSLTFERVFEKYGIKYKGKMALCPFHADKDMSLSFSDEKMVWNCFGCNEKGDIITLIKMLRGLRNGHKG